MNGYENFFTVYRIGKNDQIKEYFSQHFELSDRGRFLDLQVTDVTGNGVPDISVSYMVAHSSGGGNYWEAEDTFYLIRGHAPFDFLLEISTRKGKGGEDREGPYFMDTALTLHDIDGAVSKKRARSGEGSDKYQLKRVSLQPEIYRASFKLTPETFDHLRKKHVPNALLQQLQPLNNQGFATKVDFLQTVKQHIGKEAAEKYETLLVQYAIYHYRLEE